MATMETEGSANQLNNGEILLKKLDENCVSIEAKDAVKLSLPSRMPVSPDLDAESGGLPPDFTSPNTVLTSPPETTCFESHQHYYDMCYQNEDSPCTPKEGFFDPFAPGPDKLMLAPLCRKYLQEPRSSAARCLNFNSSVKFAGDEKCESDAETISDEELLLEMVYVDLLEVIVSSQAVSIQTETSIPEISMTDPVPDEFKTTDEFKTPTSEARLNGVAETCPGAPMKATRKFRNIDKGLCRKLEF